jgi:hypothetical protein
VGQLSVESSIDGHAMRSAKNYFMNQAFSTNPAAAFPTFGAGLLARLQGESWDVTLAGSNVQGTRANETVNLNFDSGSLFQAAQLGYDFKSSGGKSTRLQVALWHSDAVQAEGLPEGQGASLTFEQKGFRRWGQLVARYAYADGGATEVDHLASIGLGVNMSDFNRAGVGIGVGRSSSDTSQWQGVFESYLQLQLAKELTVSPNLQVVAGDALKDGNDVAVVFGLRAGLTF